MSSCRPSRSFIHLAKRGYNRCVSSAPFFFLAVPAAIALDDEGPPTSGDLPFAEPSATTCQESQQPNLIPESCLLARELFGGSQALPEVSIWNSIILDAIQTESRSGLNAEVRASLLTKYEAKENLQALIPPKLNKELVAVLTPSVIKRDEYQSASQAQVGVCLNAFGLSISVLLKSEVLQTLNDDAKAALSYFSEGIHLLSDYNYRLSLARRAFTKPFLNIIGKTAADSAPIDDFLFGQNFADTLRSAQACEKTGREVIKETPQVGKKTLQPIRQVSQRRGQYQAIKTGYSGNRQAPVRPTSARQTGTSSSEPPPSHSVSTQATLPPLTNVSFAGRLQAFHESWLDIVSDPMVLNAIVGYRIPFNSPPPARASLAEPRLSLLDSLACDSEIDRLLLKGAIVTVEPKEDQFLSSFFLIEKSSGGRRFILNLRDLNTFIDAPHFKLEDWRTIVRLMLPGMFMATLDLEDAYLLIPIYKEHRKLLRFQWRKKTFEFTALPFGLSTAPFIFTKVLRPVVTYLRKKGH